MGILEIVLPVAVSFVITVIAGKLLIPALVRLKAGQSIDRKSTRLNSSHSH